MLAASSQLISILMPVRNAAAYLNEGLQSIIRQSEQQWELLAVDDHSSDQSRAILDNFAAKDARIKVLQNTAKGIIPALQLAFAKSKGLLITRMDADDIMPPRKLELLKKLLLQHGPGHLSSGLVRYFSEGQLGDGYRRYQDWLNDLLLKGRSYEEIYRECVIPSPCWMVYRDDLIRCGAFQSDIYPEDYDLCFRFYQHQLQVLCVPEPMHLWRDHTDRASRNDPHYADQRFFELKLHYFLLLEYDAHRPLVLWGAGKKGKLMAKMLKQKQRHFHWLTNNDKKIGKNIYDILLQAQQELHQLIDPQVIVCIASPDEQLDIKKELQQLKLKQGHHYFFFC